MARRASRSVMTPVGFPSVSTTAEPTPRSIIHTQASSRVSRFSTVRTARVINEAISIGFLPQGAVRWNPVA